MSDLKPCPFCGQIPEFVYEDVEPQNDHWYSGKKEHFLKCHCGLALFDGSFHDGFGNLPEEAAKKWNARHLEAALESRVKELEREKKITLKALYLQDAQAVCKPCECSKWLELAERNLIADGEIEPKEPK